MVTFFLCIYPQQQFLYLGRPWPEELASWTLASVVTQALCSGSPHTWGIRVCRYCVEFCDNFMLELVFRKGSSMDTGACPGLRTSASGGNHSCCLPASWNGLSGTYTQAPWPPRPAHKVSHPPMTKATSWPWHLGWVMAMSVPSLDGVC